LSVAKVISLRKRRRERERSSREREAEGWREGGREKERGREGCGGWIIASLSSPLICFRLRVIDRI
jgi:hypothetical protein